MRRHVIMYWQNVQTRHYVLTECADTSLCIGRMREHAIMYVSSNSDRFPSNSKISTHILGKIEILSHQTLVVILKLVELEYVSRKLTNTLHHLLMKAIVRCQTSIGCMNTSEDET
jgi:hypothetical protein